jgi:hypothetical protein
MIWVFLVIDFILAVSDAYLAVLAFNNQDWFGFAISTVCAILVIGCVLMTIWNIAKGEKE